MKAVCLVPLAFVLASTAQAQPGAQAPVAVRAENAPQVEDHSDHEHTRSFISPTAMMMKKGHGYVAQTELFYTSLGFAVTDHLSLEVGAPLIIAGLDESLEKGALLGLKFGTSFGENLHTAANLRVVGAADPIVWGTGLVTLGNRKANLTVGAGSMHQGGESYAATTIHGYLRINASFALVTENWFFSNDGFQGQDSSSLTGEQNSIVHFYGFRMTGRRLSADLGLATLRSSDDDDKFSLPWANLVAHW